MTCEVAPPFDPVFLSASGPLRAEDAVAALIVLDDGRYVMQLRDAVPEIFYPAHWGCFGGAVEPGENPRNALARELYEELEYRPAHGCQFTRFDFDFGAIHPAQKRTYRIYYEVRATVRDYERFFLHEGAQLGAFDASVLFATLRLVPYDAFAIWLHLRRSRFAELVPSGAVSRATNPPQ